MRWLFLVLVILNLFFYFYSQQHDSAQGGGLAPQGLSELPQGITLLSESPLPGRRDAARQAEIEKSCLFLGGFDHEALALVMERRLLDLGIKSSVRPLDVAIGLDYWVYLPPLASRQASLRQLRELQSRNIDSYIITVGDLTNGISLGIFSRKDSAKGVVGRLSAVDYSPLIRELPRTHRNYWVRVAGESRHLLGAALLEDLISDAPGLQSRQMSCGSVAFSEKLE